jgi:hypothetical protein
MLNVVLLFQPLHWLLLDLFSGAAEARRFCMNVHNSGLIGLGVIQAGYYS